MRRQSALALLCLAPQAAVAQQPAKGPVSFINDVAPILKENCFACHDAKKRKGKLDMTTFESFRKGGTKETDPVEPGKPEESLLIDLVTATDKSRMPPIESGDALPADPDEYLAHDDVTLLAALRASQNPWARRIVRRQGYRVIAEDEIGAQKKLLDEAGIDNFETVSRGVLSHYGKEATLWVKAAHGEVPIGEYTPLYERYAEAATLARLYVVPERADEARRLLGL